MARLVVDSGSDEGMVFPLTESVVTLGRSPSNLIQVADRRASRYHAEIVRSGESFKLRDLGSKNGTYVQGVRLTDEYMLRHGDQIRIGHTLFVFEDEGEEAPGAGKASSSSGIKLADESAAETRGSVPAGVDRTLEAAVEVEKPAEVRDTAKRLDILMRVLKKTRTTLDLDRLLKDILDLVFDVLGPERGVILLFDRKTGALVPRVVKATGEEETISISRTIVHQAIRERVSLLIADASADERFQAAESVVTHNIRTAICAPLTVQDEVLGVLYIDSRSHKTDYDQRDLELLTAITDQAAMAISNAMLHRSLVEQNRLERELEIARTIQTNLLPKQPPIVPGFDIAAVTVPAKRVGGDYYDFIEIDSDHLGIAVADVSGKGVPAAIMTASVRAALQIEARRQQTGLQAIVGNLNEMVCRDAADNMFVALFFAVLQLSSRRLRYVNAGHCYPIVFDPEGGETYLDMGGCVLGIMPERHYDQGEVKLAPGSTLLIYSDGVTDVLNEQGEAFGLERLSAIVKEHHEDSAESLRQSIDEATAAHRGGADQFDDYTLVIIKAL